MFVYRSFWIFVLLKIVSSATISDEDIDKILGTRTDLGTDGGTDGYPSMADIDELKARLGAFAGLQDEPNFPGDMLESRENEDEEGLVSKRPFCNGFTGCGRLTGKRDAPDFLSETLPQVSDTVQARPILSKRPFCNGFFGCGNPGKRLVFRTRPLRLPIHYLTNDRLSESKRIFCPPGAPGCMNPGKRSPYRVWLERMRGSALD